ncbi:MAG: DUF4097 family beta strand repeat protein [Catenulispora sp.]|nr:DUF4097 family beta strand repeat protein [Catenulispora sp.]
MSYDVPPPHRPISAVRISTVALLGAVMAVSVPVVATAIVVSTPVSDEHATVPIAVTGPITRIVVTDSLSDVTITGDPSATGASGQAQLQWKGEHGPRPALGQHVADGVLTLSKECPPDACGPVDVAVRVPTGVSVQVNISDGRVRVMDVTGGVDLSSTDGDLEGYGLGSGPVSIRSTNGAVRAAFAGAPARIVVQTTNGDVDLSTDGHTPYDTRINTANSEPDVRDVQDSRSSNVLVVSTTNGKVTVK